MVAHIDAERGLAEASIVSASAPSHVHAGQLARVRLRVRVYRGAVRTVSFRLRIPPGVHGSTVANIKGPPLPVGAGAATAGLTSALAGTLSITATAGPPPSSAPISSLVDLRQAVAAIATYDGLSAAFRGHATRRAYRSPSLLITGRATLLFAVG